MLQWMGGSRKKVTTSRKSIHKRQKQYFQHKKRQQQTAILDNEVDGVNTCSHYHDMPKSLDILSLLNLAKAVQESKSSCTNERECSEVIPFPRNYRVLSCPSTNSTASKDFTDLKEAKTNSPGFEVKNVSPKKTLVDVPSSRNYSANKSGDKLDHSATETGCHLSVLDLLADDGSKGNLERSPVHEAHVALSVEGLGKLGMGTPPHSPQRPGRVGFNSCSSPRKPAKRYQSLKNNHSIMSDMELNLNTMTRDINMPLCGSSLELPLNSRDAGYYLWHPTSSKQTGRALDSHSCQVNNFLDSEECLYRNIKNERPWKSRSVFLDEKYPAESNGAWEDQAYNRDISTTNFLRNETHNETNFALEDSYLRIERDVAEVTREFNIIESPSTFLKRVASEKDNDFISLDGTRNPTVERRWDFDPPIWSHFSAEDAKDRMSLFSEESCPSSAVMSETASYSAPKSRKQRESLRAHCGELLREDTIKNHQAEEIWYENSGKIQRRKNLTGSRKYTRILDPSWSRSVDLPDEPSFCQKDLESQKRWLVKEGYPAVDIDSLLCASGITEKSESASLEGDWSGDLFAAFPVSDIYQDRNPSYKRSKVDASVKCTPSSNFFFENVVCPQSFSPRKLYDTPEITNVGSKSKKSDVSQASRTEDKLSFSSHVSDSNSGFDFPALSEKENGPINHEAKAESQQTDHGGICNDHDKEVLNENNDAMTESGKTVESPICRDSSECMEAEADVCEVLSEKPKTMASSGQAEERSSASKEVASKLERFILDKHGVNMDFSCQSQSKGKKESLSEERTSRSEGEHNMEPSYQVMLESYVLQLLCVQKVLKEASEPDSAKKTKELEPLLGLADGRTTVMGMQLHLMMLGCSNIMNNSASFIQTSYNTYLSLQNALVVCNPQVLQSSQPILSSSHWSSSKQHCW